jgi:CHASE3 domain sensor protein
MFTLRKETENKLAQSVEDASNAMVGVALIAVAALVVGVVALIVAVRNG